jgi:hypothetical protein
MALRSRGARAPELYLHRSPSSMRGRREDRVRAAPAVSCAICTKKCAHEHTGPAESIRPSLRNGSTAYAVLSSETNSFCLRHRRIDGVRAPGRARNASADLTPATGARTTRFCRTQQRRSSCAGSTAHGFCRPAISLARNAIASTAARTPRIVTTRTPLFMRRDDAMRTSFSKKVKRIIFGGRAGRPKSR